MKKPVFIGCETNDTKILKAFEFLIRKTNHYDGYYSICLTDKHRHFFADPEIYKNNPSYKYVSIEKFLKLIALNKESFERNFRED